MLGSGTVAEEGTVPRFLRQLEMGDTGSSNKAEQTEQKLAMVPPGLEPRRVGAELDGHRGPVGTDDKLAIASQLIGFEPGSDSRGTQPMHLPTRAPRLREWGR
jgi:hypothetical protein